MPLKLYRNLLKGREHFCAQSNVQYSLKLARQLFLFDCDFKMPRFFCYTCYVIALYEVIYSWIIFLICLKAWLPQLDPCQNNTLHQPTNSVGGCEHILKLGQLILITSTMYFKLSTQKALLWSLKPGIAVSCRKHNWSSRKWASTIKTCEHFSWSIKTAKNWDCLASVTDLKLWLQQEWRGRLQSLNRQFKRCSWAVKLRQVFCACVTTLSDGFVKVNPRCFGWSCRHGKLLEQIQMYLA